jgi:hypothetical protein
MNWNDGGWLFKHRRIESRQNQSINQSKGRVALRWIICIQMNAAALLALLMGIVASVPNPKIDEEQQENKNEHFWRVPHW